jgi:hypothetical protein
MKNMERGGTSRERGEVTGLPGRVYEQRFVQAAAGGATGEEEVAEFHYWNGLPRKHAIKLTKVERHSPRSQADFALGALSEPVPAGLALPLSRVPKPLGSRNMLDARQRAKVVIVGHPNGGRQLQRERQRGGRSRTRRRTLRGERGRGHAVAAGAPRRGGRHGGRPPNGAAGRRVARGTPREKLLDKPTAAGRLVQ